MVVTVVRIAGKPAMRIGFAMALMVIVMIVCMMVMVVPAVGAVPGIGAPQGIERLDFLNDRCAETFEHVFDDMIAQDQDTVRFDRGWQMPVADVPGKFAQMQCIARPDFIDLLGRRHDADMTTVIEHQKITIIKRCRLQKIDEKLATIPERQDAPSQMPLVMLEDNDIERFEIIRGGPRAKEASGPWEFREVGVQ